MTLGAVLCPGQICQTSDEYGRVLVDTAGQTSWVYQKKNDPPTGLTPVQIAIEALSSCGGPGQIDSSQNSLTPDHDWRRFRFRFRRQPTIQDQTLVRREPRRGERMRSGHQANGHGQSMLREAVLFP